MTIDEDLKVDNSTKIITYGQTKVGQKVEFLTGGSHLVVKDGGLFWCGELNLNKGAKVYTESGAKILVEEEFTGNTVDYYHTVLSGKSPNQKYAVIIAQEFTKQQNINTLQ